MRKLNPETTFLYLAVISGIVGVLCGAVVSSATTPNVSYYACEISFAIMVASFAGFLFFRVRRRAG